MYAIIVDDRSNAKLVPLSPLDGFATDYLTPCGGCGDVVLSELTVDCICLQCNPNVELHKELEDKGWMWEHPGYWRKNFGNRITVVAGTSEYRFDFFLAGEDYDLAEGPEFCIDLDKWTSSALDLRERGCFTLEEMEELELIYRFLYTDYHKDRVRGNDKWYADYGSLLQPNGMYLCGTDQPIHLTKEMLFDNMDDDTEMTKEQGHIFCDLCSIIVEFVTKKIK